MNTKGLFCPELANVKSKFSRQKPERSAFFQLISDRTPKDWILCYQDTIFERSSSSEKTASAFTLFNETQNIFKLDCQFSCHVFCAQLSSVLSVLSPCLLHHSAQKS